MVMVHARAHLLCAQGHVVEVGPALLGSFTIGMTHPTREVEREGSLTFLDMGSKVKFWNEELHNLCVMI